MSPDWDPACQNIIDYRTENGPFKSRKELLKVKEWEIRLWTKRRILRNKRSREPLDESAVHPESYHCWKDGKGTWNNLRDLIENEEKERQLNWKAIFTESWSSDFKGYYWWASKPGRDPRTKNQGIQVCWYSSMKISEKEWLFLELWQTYKIRSICGHRSKQTGWYIFQTLANFCSGPSQ